MSRSRRWTRWTTGTLAVSLLAGTALLSGCFYPYPYRHHGGGYYRYDDGHHRDDGHHHGDRDRDRRDRDHDWDWDGHHDGRHR